MKIDNLFAKLRSYFFSGVVLIAPISITIYIIWWAVTSLDEWFLNLMPSHIINQESLLFLVPGVGFLMAMSLLIILGAIGRGVVGSWILKTGEQILDKLPIVRGIYGGSKQVFEAFLGKNSLSFRQVGLIEFPRKGIWSLCFITGTAQGEVQHKTSDEVINVFMPTTPNPTSGFLLFVPKSDIIFLSMTIDEGIKMVMSAGIVTPSFPKENNSKNQTLEVQD